MAAIRFRRFESRRLLIAELVLTVVALSSGAWGISIHCHCGMASSNTAPTTTSTTIATHP